MRKFLLFTLCFAFLLFAGCGGKQEQLNQIPPGLSQVQNQMTLKKHSTIGENTAFSQADFNSFLGEEAGDVTIEALPQKGTLVCNGAAVLKGQTIPAESLNYLRFVPAAGCEKDIFYFSCKNSAYGGNQMACQMVFTSETDLPPVAVNSSLEAVSGISCHGKLNITEPNGDSFTVNVVTYPTDGYITVNKGGNVVYTPKKGFDGNDKMVYTVTDSYGNVSDSATLSINVLKNQGDLVFKDMESNPNHIYAHKMCRDNVMVYRMENGEYYFDPQSNVSKIEFLVMAMCVTGLDASVTAVADSVITDDTQLSSGLKGYISYAAKEKLINIQNGKFSPADSITLSDAAFTVAKALNLPVTAAANGTRLQPAVAAMLSANLLTAEEAAADPTATLSKEYTAKLLCRIEDYIKENNIQKAG